MLVVASRSTIGTEWVHLMWFSFLSGKRFCLHFTAFLSSSRCVICDLLMLQIKVVMAATYLQHLSTVQWGSIGPCDCLSVRRSFRWFVTQFHKLCLHIPLLHKSRSKWTWLSKSNCGYRYLHLVFQDKSYYTRLQKIGSKIFAENTNYMGVGD